ncbi:MAG: hypothetical protein M3Y53_03510 [Thermoproteota archaeon]|nr:hypothetical protein [Thermoproteota archaeon]
MIQDTVDGNYLALILRPTMVNSLEISRYVNRTLCYVFIAFQISLKKKMNLLEKMNGLVASVSWEAISRW